MNPLRFLLPVASAVLLSLANTPAATVVNWDGGTGGQTYVAANTSANLASASGGVDVTWGGSGSLTDRQQLRGYSSSAALSPASSYGSGVNTANYSTTFYGAYESLVIDSTSGTSINAATVRSTTADGSYIRGSFGQPTGKTFVATEIVAFKKSDFLNGGNSGSIILSNISMTLINPVVSSGTASNMRGRWFLQNGSTIYLSQATFSMDAGTVSLSDFTTSQWAVYTPSTTPGTVLNFTPTSFSTVNFNDAQMVGFYTETWDGVDQIIAGSGVAASNQAGFSMTDFTVTTVPEPRAVALLALGGVCFFFLRRRAKAAC